MKIKTVPIGGDRLVQICNEDWGLEWQLQFPEVVMSDGRSIMAWPLNCRPDWKPLGSGGWCYHWRASEEYIEEVRSMGLVDTNGVRQHVHFVRGVTLYAEIVPGDGMVDLTVSLTNETDEDVKSVYCDGGCFQARNEAFIGNDEVMRSFVRTDGKMKSMGLVHRTVAIRSMYCHSEDWYDGKDEWFWGRSGVAIDSPAIVGAVSVDRSMALVFGYEQSYSALANSDEHHCLHSRPLFGDLMPGETVTRCGKVIFGSDIVHLGDRLAAEL
ncbi:hypothetical protein [Pelagicoccus mobilis]|uniref:Uncharacterized protein n=1 Tax=Pelagicoccus mobilis TaxID=415221 RepID=A0A934VPE1_9BACT|nr:hypothetical protein [Pelagicoccus mobilis]MBK1877192.1 hypothetical protein [Pelagicoccus mobilis]